MDKPSQFCRNYTISAAKPRTSEIALDVALISRRASRGTRVFWTGMGLLGGMTVLTAVVLSGAIGGVVYAALATLRDAARALIGVG